MKEARCHMMKFLAFHLRRFPFGFRILLFSFSGEFIFFKLGLHSAFERLLCVKDADTRL